MNDPSMITPANDDQWEKLLAHQLEIRKTELDAERTAKVDLARMDKQEATERREATMQILTGASIFLVVIVAILALWSAIRLSGQQEQKRYEVCVTAGGSWRGSDGPRDSSCEIRQ